ncbi:MAG TPA: neutral zinc metallopeptidase [bacterium]|uniref:Putative neutral zinc metallopeptidase n=1 Tax=candidate division TA06 bacterium ADurb.Bin417 TaxID=1852828 RepID=A0A1V5MCX4_UNCT6|nr:MAG: putative neutral zinc metallopeptidase [candidate division TA06 bacterium ADurb.Bin417]HNQ34965.1 neutral zinc metallopeptidase [bacterium]HNS48832.1 neutral zinc metallopeptidase [bacterium]
MRWQGRRRSSNVEDLRGSSGNRALRVGGGLSGIGVLIALAYLFLGGNPAEVGRIFQGAPSYSVESGQELTEAEKEMGEFVSTVLADLEDVWQKEFRQMGLTYEEPALVLFSGAVETAAGYASASTGPFYSPADSKVYIDLTFFEEMQRQLNAPGDFALAYVLAHEVGHHVQNLLGINEKVMSQRNRMSEKEFNRLLVRLELQADFLAGVWAHYARQIPDYLEATDIEEGLNAASAVGDDRIMKQSQGYVVPDAFTHGTSEQRVRWFRKGLETGDINQGDTFGAARL